MEEGVLVYPSEFMENIFINVVNKENIHYEQLKKYLVTKPQVRR